MLPFSSCLTGTKYSRHFSRCNHQETWCPTCGPDCWVDFWSVSTFVVVLLLFYSWLTHKWSLVSSSFLTVWSWHLVLLFDSPLIWIQSFWTMDIYLMKGSKRATNEQMRCTITRLTFLEEEIYGLPFNTSQNLCLLSWILSICFTKSGKKREGTEKSILLASSSNYWLSSRGSLFPVSFFHKREGREVSEWQEKMPESCTTGKKEE